VIRTPLTDLLGISCPIIQTGMGYVAGARLAAATSRAGGLGVIASATMSTDELRSAIKEVKERTGAPFGVNLRADAPDAGERVDVRELVGFCDQRGCDFAQLFLEVGLARRPSVHPMLGGAWGDRTREVSSLSR